MNLVDVASLVKHELGAEVLEPEEMGVKATAPYLVATGLGHGSLAETTEQRPVHQHRATQTRAFLHELHAIEEVQVHVIGLERVVVTVVARNLHAHVLQQLYEVVHVQDVGHVGYAHWLRGEQRGAYHLQRLVFGALRCDGSLQLMSTFYYE